MVGTSDISRRCVKFFKLSTSNFIKYTKSMEKLMEIKSLQNHFISGTLNYKNESDKLIIFVHWLTGNQNEHFFFNAAKFFPENWFSTFRFDLYSNERPLSKTTVKEHSQDLSSVIEYFKTRYKKIYLVWHSLWWPTVLWSDIENIAATTLREPTLNFTDYAEKFCTYNENLWKYILHRDIEPLISKEMTQERKNIDERIIEQIIVPTKIICAWRYRLKDHWILHHEKIKVDHEFIIIENAGHCFHQEGTEEKLFAETLNWFIKY
jgi:pimeloyl-ACP methyl ester carboxylesterase